MCNERFIKLKAFMEELTREDIGIAFSGGTDSSLLLKLASEFCKIHQTKVYAVTFSTKLHPKADILQAKQVAEECHVELNILEIDERENPKIEDNPVDRCYHCKKYLFEQLIKFAEDRKVKRIIDGTNADDLKEYRPGLKALTELGIISPLAKQTITKKEVREMAEQLGISTANRPSAPCMATRLPYGTKIDYKILEDLERGENYLKSLGFLNIRLRKHGEILRIEVDKNDFSHCLEQMEEIVGRMKELGFSYITLDLEGFRSGSMDIGLKKEE